MTQDTCPATPKEAVKRTFVQACAPYGGSPVWLPLAYLAACAINVIGLVLGPTAWEPAVPFVAIMALAAGRHVAASWAEAKRTWGGRAWLGCWLAVCVGIAIWFGWRAWTQV